MTRRFLMMGCLALAIGASAGVVHAAFQVHQCTPTAQSTAITASDSPTRKFNTETVMNCPNNLFSDSVCCWKEVVAISKWDGTQFVNVSQTVTTRNTDPCNINGVDHFKDYPVSSSGLYRLDLAVQSCASVLITSKTSSHTFP